ncbi:Leo1-like protein [Trypanosoma melophagium]|uniref:Leo1-like protein n=1 Tax=Trypanosoma melophagium TaxID=715481 RepID=UPI00351A0D3F|nr:Leo1-like protein [Trypanosoma melophagium]
MDPPLDEDQLTVPPNREEGPPTPSAITTAASTNTPHHSPEQLAAVNLDVRTDYNVDTHNDGNESFSLPTHLMNEDDATLAVEDLFGELFEVGDQRPVDPVLIDTRNILLNLFGSFIREEDVDFEDEKQTKLIKEMADNKAAARFAVVEKWFGEAGAAALEDQRIESFGCLQSSLPDKPDIGPCERLWLTDMPKIAPNRQTLHMDPKPFLPSSCTPLKNTDRMLYTTQNVIRWAHHQGTNTFMSNARVVRWSDGSVTMHVGSDLFTLQPSKESALTMLARPAVVRKGNVGIPAMVSALNPDEHFVVEGATAASIEEAVIAESAQFRSVSTQHNLAYAIPALPNINWNNIKTVSNPVEEYIMKEYNRRQKIIEQRKKEGRPMTLTEQMEMENELLQRLQTLSAEELLVQQQEQQREAALRAATRQQPTSRRSRFDRNMNLEGGVDVVSGEEIFQGREREDNNDYYGDDDNDDGEEDYETMLENMRQKRQREEEAEDNERMRRIQRLESAQVSRYSLLMDALREVITHLPAGSNARGSVQGTLDFLGTGAFSAGVVEKEVPLMMEEVAEEFPELDLSRVRQELEKLHR